MESCPICNETKKPFHFHYGATCCLKCRAFFRRVIQTNGTTNLENVFSCTSCTQHNNCDMQKFGVTHKCPKCRLMRCLEIGMRPDKVVMDEETRTKFTGKVSFFTDYRSYSKRYHFSGFKKRKKCISLPLNDRPQQIAEIGVEYSTREKLNLNKDNLNKEELIKDDENQMMASLYDSVSLNFNEAIAETNVSQDLLMILKEFFFTEMPIKKIDVYHKISKIFTFNRFC